MEEISWTVVLPTYNRAALLKRAIESCQAQTLPCQIVVVDDHSSDETPRLLANYPDIVSIRNARNSGHSITVNRGMERADGSWIKHLDDDDYLHPDCLRRMTRAILLARARGHDPKIVTSVATNVDIAGHVLGNTTTLPIRGPAIIGRRDLLAMMMRDQAPFGTPVQVAHDRRAALDAGGWNAARRIPFRNGDEAECWIRLAAQGDALFLPDALGYRTIWEGNEAPPIAARRQISLHLKALIADQMGGPHRGRIPDDIVRYLDLHWGLVALRDRQLSTGLRLVLGGLFDPRSYRHIIRRARFADAMALICPLG